ncbi:unnamed protein product [Pelagomonas calceolata]|uniref:Uncharacterized protein n=1 Tax=Pelagomonas calceolata TaxID=35677 RepID=A0A8J2SJK7_9STRA|nr:unnamed protein product [Pelagomonas calceolata]|mmetsp:Transcript_26467/g.80288  ORF Transcript_26467/g.80288 Transcript_26467/m.80288 type:complete len:288 (+) Transcript_26467:703-1566(+)
MIGKPVTSCPGRSTWGTGGVQSVPELQLQPLVLRSQAPRLVARPDVDVVRPTRAARRDADEPQLGVDVLEVRARAARVEELEGREARDGVDYVRRVRRELSLRVQRVLDVGTLQGPGPEPCRGLHKRPLTRRQEHALVTVPGAPPREFVAHVDQFALEGQVLRDLVDDEIALQGQRGELRRLARRLRRHALAQAPGAREAKLDEGARLVVALVDAKQPVDGGRDVSLAVEGGPELLARLVHCDWRGRRRDGGRRCCVLRRRRERCALQRRDSRCALRRRERGGASQA